MRWKASAALSSAAMRLVRSSITFAVVLTFPLFLPPYIVALGWFSVLGRQGLLAAALGPGAGVSASAFFFGLGGAVLVLTTAYTPIVVHLVRIALGSIDPAIEEAARLHFRWRRIVWRACVGSQQWNRSGRPRGLKEPS